MQFVYNLHRQIKKSCHEWTPIDFLPSFAFGGNVSNHHSTISRSSYWSFLILETVYLALYGDEKKVGYYFSHLVQCMHKLAVHLFYELAIVLHEHF